MAGARVSSWLPWKGRAGLALAITGRHSLHEWYWVLRVLMYGGQDDTVVGVGPGYLLPLLMHGPMPSRCGPTLHLSPIDS